MTPVVNVSLGGELAQAIRTHLVVTDDGEVPQARRLPHGSGVPDSVEGLVPQAVRDAHGDRVQLHCVRWNSDSEKHHTALQISSEGFRVKCLNLLRCIRTVSESPAIRQMGL